MNRLSGRRWAVGAAASGTVLIAGGAFWLSFVALADLAVRSGISTGQAWIWPLLVDGLIVVATVAVVALDRHRSAWYPWALLIAGALVSVTANAAHALVASEATVPGMLASTVAAVPPLVLLASTHLTVVLIRSSRTDDGSATETGTPKPLPAPHAEPDPALASPELVLVPAKPEAPTHQRGSGPSPAPAPSDKVGGFRVADAAGAGRRERAAWLREEGWSNKQIARELDVHPSTIGRWLPRPPELPGSSDSSGSQGAGITPVVNKEETP